MKTVVFFLVSLNPEVGKVNVPSLKKKVVEYVGTRMLAEDLCDFEHCPGIVLNDTLSDVDKKTLDSIVNGNGDHGVKAALLFLELTDEEYETLSDTTYIDCIGKS